MVVPSPSDSVRLRATMRVTLLVTAPTVFVACSKTKSPDSRWEPITSVTPTPSMRRYGPAGRSSVTVSVPTVKESLTAASVVLVWIVKSPWKSNPLTPTMANRPLTWPATPAGDRTNRPVPWSSFTPTDGVPRLSVTSLAKMRMIRGGVALDGAPGGSVPSTCSKAKTPDRL